jgi:hypothetical protein
VLKGPRPVQRRNAQFWTGVTTDTSELVGRVQDVQEGKPDKQAQEEQNHEVVETSAMPENVTLEMPSIPASEVSEIPSTDEGSTVTNEQSNEGTAEGVSETTPPKRRTRAASAVTRTKKPRSTGLKPSQRGFKWPTQE